MFQQHLSNLWQCYYEGSANAATAVIERYNDLSAKLAERVCPSEKLLYSYYESIEHHKVNVVCVPTASAIALSLFYVEIIARTRSAYLHCGYIVIQHSVYIKQELSYRKQIAHPLHKH